MLDAQKVSNISRHLYTALSDLLDLTQRESELYIELLRRGRATVKELKSGIDAPRTRLYSILRKLSDEGFIIQDKKTTPTEYVVFNPLTIIDEVIKRESAENDARAVALRALADDLSLHWRRDDIITEKGWLTLEPLLDATSDFLYQLKNVESTIFLAIKEGDTVVDWTTLADTFYNLHVAGVSIKVLANSHGLISIIRENLPAISIRLYEELPISLAILDDYSYQFHSMTYDIKNSFVLKSSEPQARDMVTNIFHIFWQKSGELL